MYALQKFQFILNFASSPVLLFQIFVYLNIFVIFMIKREMKTFNYSEGKKIRKLITEDELEK